MARNALTQMALTNVNVLMDSSKNSTETAQVRFYGTSINNRLNIKKIHRFKQLWLISVRELGNSTCHTQYISIFTWHGPRTLGQNCIFQVSFPPQFLKETSIQRKQYQT